MQEVEDAKIVSSPANLSMPAHTFLFSSSDSGTHSCIMTHCLIAVSSLQHTDLDVGCSGHTVLQTVSTRDELGLLQRWQLASQCSSLLKLEQLGLDVSYGLGHLIC